MIGSGSNSMSIGGGVPGRRNDAASTQITGTAKISETPSAVR
jgi:hypothetical protein